MKLLTKLRQNKTHYEIEMDCEGNEKDENNYAYKTVTFIFNFVWI